MKSKTIIKAAIFQLSFGIMTIADYYLIDKAEYFNLYHLLLSIFSSADKHYIIFQQNLGNYALPLTLAAVTVFHIIAAEIIYKLFHNTFNRRNHEKA
jgi:hypothetical protein